MWGAQRLFRIKYQCRVKNEVGILVASHGAKKQYIKEAEKILLYNNVAESAQNHDQKSSCSLHSDAA